MPNRSYPGQLGGMPHHLDASPHLENGKMCPVKALSDKYAISKGQRAQGIFAHFLQNGSCK